MIDSYSDLTWGEGASQVPCLVIEMEYCMGGDMFTALTTKGALSQDVA